MIGQGSEHHVILQGVQAPASGASTDRAPAVGKVFGTDGASPTGCRFARSISQKGPQSPERPRVKGTRGVDRKEIGAPTQVAPGAEGPLGSPRYRGIEHVQEPIRQEASHPGIHPDEGERNPADPGGRRTKPKPVEPGGVPASLSPKGEDRSPSAEQIALSAYYLWLGRGQPVGTAWDDWLEAERQLAATA